MALGHKVNVADTYTKTQIDSQMDNKADKMLPALYNFAYSEAYIQYASNQSRYFKQAGVCHIMLNASKKSGNITGGDLVATMPVGFRLVGGGIFFPCVFNGTTTEAGTLHVTSDGSITVKTISASTHIRIFAAFSYRADQY